MAVAKRYDNNYGGKKFCSIGPKILLLLLSKLAPFLSSRTIMR
jgi:hypothetical protein